MENNLENFIQLNSPDGALKHTLQGKDFLQSEEWRKFQESVGRKTFNISSDGFWANVIEHKLPMVGKYFYIPKGPIFNFQFSIFNQFSSNNDKIFKQNIQDLIKIAKENKAGWIRIDPANNEILDIIKKNTKFKITKAPHDMQPKEILMLDIKKSEEELLAEMKAKTRYNIRLAEKKGVKIHLIYNSPNKISNDKIQISNQFSNSNDQHTNNKYIDEFIKLVKITAKRDGIVSHPENYYRKMFKTIPKNILKLYVAEYGGKIIAANLIIFYGKTATYLHGASDNERRSLMAPYLLQWQAIKDAKAAGYAQYDFGGINTKKGKGITKFKTGFAPNTKSVEFPGSYDIVINPWRYNLYRMMQNVKGFFRQ